MSLHLQNKPAPAQDERVAFEKYMLDREHPVIGWIWTDWFKRGDDPETYANDYVQGAWVMWQAARPAQTEQQPVAHRECRVIGFRPGMGEVTFYVDGGVPAWMNIGETIYVSDAAPIAQTAPHPEQSERWQSVTRPGQIDVGDWLSFTVGGCLICAKARDVLNPGTDREEVIYNRAKNYYFITRMAVDGSSSHKGVMRAAPCAHVGDT